VQLGLFSPQLPEPSNLDVTLARIAKLVGEDCVGRAVLRDSHERDSFVMDRFQLSEASSAPAPPRQATSAMRQLRPAEDVSLTFCNERPQHLRFREQHYRIERAYGPWLSGGEWWNTEIWNAEQWDIIARASDGTLLCGCIIRDLIQGRWQMVGLYD
jgi:protein ImuB